MWGATAHQCAQIAPKSFNPRTRVGCDGAYPLDPKSPKQFQSTHPCGVRQSTRFFYVCQSVSIHAPVWGATVAGGAKRGIRGFNPRTRVGCDFLQQFCHWRARFQSTHPCGVRPLLGANAPTSIVSIHAPVWGATRYAPPFFPLFRVSIHAPVWGATKA